MSQTDLFKTDSDLIGLNAKNNSLETVTRKIYM